MVRLVVRHGDEISGLDCWVIIFFWWMVVFGRWLWFCFVFFSFLPIVG